LRKILIIAVVVLAAIASSFAVTLFTDGRIAGTAAATRTSFTVTADSTDTFYVDTFHSDTFDIADAFDAVLCIHYDGHTLADSANDSTVLIFETLLSFDGTAAHVAFTDTIEDTNAIALSDSMICHNIPDSMMWNKVWVRTIVKDSVITTTAQTNTYSGLIHVKQRPVVNR